MSLKFFVLAEWDELVDLGSVSTRPRTSQGMNNKEAFRLSLSETDYATSLSTS